MPHALQVAGMNWVHPIAPADDGPMLQPRPDSTCVMPARICQRSPNDFAALFQVCLSAAEPEHGLTVATWLRTCGTAPRAWFDAFARMRRLPALAPGGAGLWPVSTCTQSPGWPRRAAPWRHERWRWLPRPWLASPL